jgi:hypothetical protein
LKNSLLENKEITELQQPKHEVKEENKTTKNASGYKPETINLIYNL